MSHSYYPTLFHSQILEKIVYVSSNSLYLLFNTCESGFHLEQASESIPIKTSTRSFNSLSCSLDKHTSAALLYTHPLGPNSIFVISLLNSFKTVLISLFGYHSCFFFVQFMLCIADRIIFLKYKTNVTTLLKVSPRSLPNT